MRHLTRSKRNQRVAILAMVVMLGVWLLVGPILSDIFGGPRKPSSSPVAASPGNLLNKKK